MSINIFFYIFSFLFSLGQLGRVSLNNGQINFYLYEIFLLTVLVVLLIKFGFKPLKQAFSKYKIIYIFFIWLLLTNLLKITSFSLNDNAVSLLYLSRLLFYPLFFLYLSRTKVDKNIFKKSFLIFIILTLVISFIQYFLYPDLRNLYYFGWDPHLNRMFGTFFDTSIAASVYGLIFLYLFKNKKYLFSVLPLICLVLTFSRSAYLILGLTLLANFLSKNRIKYVLLIMIVFLLIFIVVPKQFGAGVGISRSFSIFSRVNDYKNALSIWQKHPLTGIGYNRIEHFKKQAGILNKKENIPVNSAASFSSSYLIILTTTGVVGLILFIASLWKIYINNKKILVYLVFIGLLSFADNIFLHPFIMTIIGAFIVLSDN